IMFRFYMTPHESKRGAGDPGDLEQTEGRQFSESGVEGDGRFTTERPVNPSHQAVRKIRRRNPVLAQSCANDVFVLEPECRGLKKFFKGVRDLRFLVSVGRFKNPDQFA